MTTDDTRRNEMALYAEIASRMLVECGTCGSVRGFVDVVEDELDGDVKQARRCPDCLGTGKIAPLLSVGPNGWRREMPEPKPLTAGELDRLEKLYRGVYGMPRLAFDLFSEAAYDAMPALIAASRERDQLVENLIKERDALRAALIPLAELCVGDDPRLDDDSALWSRITMDKVRDARRALGEKC